MEVLEFEIEITASGQRVWNTIIGAETFPIWTSPFAEGSYFVGSWEKGSHIRFLVPSGDGMLSEIVACKPGELLSIRHLKHIEKGVVSDGGVGVPASENYIISSRNDKTLLCISTDAHPKYVAFFKETWPKSLAILKQLCEA